MQNKKTNNIEASKLKSALQHSDNSRESYTGYMDRGNPATVHQKARVIRNNENGSHV